MEKEDFAMRRAFWMLSLSVLAMATGVDAVRAQQVPPANAPPQAPPAADAKQQSPPGNPLEELRQRASRFASGEFDANPWGFLDWGPVQKDLKLTPEQKEKLKAINEEFRASRRKQLEGPTGATAEDRPAKAAELRAKARQSRAEYKRKIDAVLLLEQRSRLGQMTLQLRGPLAALADEEVANALKLTDEQKKQIQAIEEATGEKVRSALQSLRERRSAAQGDLEAKASDLRDQAVQQALGVLTPEQKQSFEKMKGENFPVERPRLRPFRRAKPPASPPENPPPAEKPVPADHHSPDK
jgi:Spy/CpxP family protein refolding chaperone